MPPKTWNLTPKQKQLSVRKRHLITFRRYLALKSGDSALDDYLDMNAFELREYIQGMWQEGMTWENYGTVWVVDHIVPLAYFDSFSRKDMKLCWCHYNLQPTFYLDNHIKGYSPDVSVKMLETLPNVTLVQMLKSKVSEFDKVYDKYLTRILS